MDFQINLTFEFVMTVVGIMTFVSMISIFEQFNLITMQNVKTLIMQILMGLFISVSCGVTFVERMAFQTPNYNVIKPKLRIRDFKFIIIFFGVVPKSVKPFSSFLV